jgi:hypothetical protein
LVLLVKCCFALTFCVPISHFVFLGALCGNLFSFDNSALCGQVEDNLKALEVLPKLTPDVLEKIEAVMQNKPTRPKAFRE